MVGLTATNALSEIFEIISYRYGEKSRVAFSQGKQVGSQTTEKIRDKEKHGTVFILKPSKIYMGDDCNIIADDLIDWVDKISYLLPQGIDIVLSVKKKGKESIIKKKYKNDYGLYDLTKKMCSKSIVDPIHFIQTMRIDEKVHDKVLDRFIGLEVGFTYDSTSVDFDFISFCNFVITVDGGTHVDAVKTAILQYLTKQTKDSLSDRDSKKIDITFSDATQGLFLAVNVSTDLQPNYTGQTKEKVGSQELFKPLRDMTYKALTEYFNKNPRELKKLTDRVKANARARIESTKVRNSVIKGETNNFDEHLMDNFVPANNRGKNDYRELFIIEGRSAKGTCETGRFDRNTQAVFSIRGVPLNAFGVKLDKVLLNAEFNSLVKILKCNIGERFDLSKLNYNKIILLADSDSDGYSITSLLCAFFLTHLPKIIEDGRLYKSVAPLYKIKSKYKEFVLNKKEYYDTFERHVRDAMIISDPKTNKLFSEEQIQDLFMTNRNYLDDLIRLSNHLVIDPIILEYIIVHRNDKDFYKQFKKVFPELTIEGNVLTGIYEGKYQILIMDYLFEKRIKDLDTFIKEENAGSMYFHVIEKTVNGNIDRGKLSLGQFLTLAQKYQPIIKTRFKG